MRKRYCLLNHADWTLLKYIYYSNNEYVFFFILIVQIIKQYV